VADAERAIAQPEDLATVHARAADVDRILSERRTGGLTEMDQPASGPVS
jgi:hypothetical protein